MIHWDAYLWSAFEDFLPGSGDEIMYAAGAVEIIAGLLVAVRPRIGGPVVALLPLGVVINLVIMGVSSDVFWDLALRDAGLVVGALALSLLAFKYSTRRSRRTTGESWRTGASRPVPSAQSCPPPAWAEQQSAERAEEPRSVLGTLTVPVRHLSRCGAADHRPADR